MLPVCQTCVGKSVPLNSTRLDYGSRPTQMTFLSFLGSLNIADRTSFPFNVLNRDNEYSREVPHSIYIYIYMTIRNSVLFDNLDYYK